ncbi:MAG TPA: serine--tRNA ligase [Thermoanaerobaculia bacterium]|nr:serine--tRNA ligase [Thermoanaerobaculia bacterium]
MISREYLRENADAYRDALRNRGASVDLDRFLELDAERRRFIAKVETLKNQRNVASHEIARRRKAKEDAAAPIEAMRLVGDEIKELDRSLAEIEQALEELELGFPNVPHDSVPVGADESANREERVWGERPSFSFTPREHWEIGEQLGILDFDRAAKIAGARFSVLFGAGAKLERALITFMLDLHSGRHGYTEVWPPAIVNGTSMRGTGQLPKFEEDLFKLRGDRDLYLISTAEVPVTNLHRDEILGAEELTISYCAYTPCFRSEAGSYGKDTRGLIRQHQFDKVELVKFARPEDSWDEHERLTEDACEVLRQLGLYHRVVTLSTGDMGFGAAKTYDIEVWLPGQNTFREISSCTNFGDFQARRANIRYRRDEKKTAFVHTLNGSGLAVGRTLVAILENYQQADGSVVLPEPLRKCMGTDRLTPTRKA